MESPGDGRVASPRQREVVGEVAEFAHHVACADEVRDPPEPGGRTLFGQGGVEVPGIPAASTNNPTRNGQLRAGSAAAPVAGQLSGPQAGSAPARATAAGSSFIALS